MESSKTGRGGTETPLCPPFPLQLPPHHRQGCFRVGRFCSRNPRILRPTAASETAASPRASATAMGPGCASKVTSSATTTASPSASCCHHPLPPPNSVPLAPQRLKPLKSLKSCILVLRWVTPPLTACTIVQLQSPPRAAAFPSWGWWLCNAHGDTGHVGVRAAHELPHRTPGTTGCSIPQPQGTPSLNHRAPAGRKAEAGTLLLHPLPSCHAMLRVGPRPTLPHRSPWGQHRGPGTDTRLLLPASLHHPIPGASTKSTGVLPHQPHTAGRAPCE